MKLKRIVRILAKALAAIIFAVIIVAGAGWIYFHPRIELTRGVVYGNSHGRNLTFDTIRPAHPNGACVIFMVSGGWKSDPNKFQPWITAPLLRRGYTVFAVSHISQPDATVMEITEEVNRAVRYIRHYASGLRIDPERLGVTGGSSGGHLSLMLATRGGPGPANSSDPVDRESSAVQAVAVFYPVTDLLNLGSSTENPGNGGPPRSFVKAFGSGSTEPATWQAIGRSLSPIFHVTEKLPPTLIYHGDADTLVPLDQSERFQAEARKHGSNVMLVVHHAGQHGWLSMVWDIRQFADWFDKYLSSRV
ncbi:MAG: hypothetical protein JWL59_3073 [Chthoniobacteraceae bacterium]|nr:hypothetical protein [Chthoniobacteraceae bacterium]